MYNAPFFPYILEAWSKRHHPNMHFMFYEDMKRVGYLTSIFICGQLSRKSQHSKTWLCVCVNRICGERSERWLPFSENRWAKSNWWRWQNTWNLKISKRMNRSIMNWKKRLVPLMRKEDFFVKVYPAKSRLAFYFIYSYSFTEICFVNCVKCFSWCRQNRWLEKSL